MLAAYGLERAAGAYLVAATALAAISGVSLGGLSPSFWALLGGTAVAMVTAARPGAKPPGRPAPARGQDQDEQAGTVQPRGHGKEAEMDAPKAQKG